MFNPKKIVVLIASTTSLMLTACSGGTSTSSCGYSVNVEDERAQAVTISRVPTVPTNGGVLHPVILNVENHTDEKLTFVDSKFMNSKNQGMLSRAINKVNRALGGTGYNSYVGMDQCKTLERGASCTLSVTPDVADGSTVIQLSFKDDNSKVYNTAQLVNYSSSSSSQNGFIVNTDNMREFHSTNDYSVTIPFIADDDYQSITVSSDIMALNKSFNCNGKVTKGSACSATLKLPAAPKAGYANKITISGKTTSGKVNTYTINTRAYFDDRPSLELTRGPVHLQADNTPGADNSVSIAIVNNGVLSATGINDKHSALSTEFEGVILQANAGENPITSLERTFDPATCNFTGATANKIGHTAPVGSACEASFTMNSNSLEQNGHDEYRITYNGEAGANTIKTTTIYYTGLSGYDPNCPTCQRPHDYQITGTLDFTDTDTNTNGKTQTITINNTGMQPLHNIAFTLPTVAGLTIDRNGCDTSNLANNTLGAKESCSIDVHYRPTADVTFGSAIATINVTRADGSNFSGSTKTLSVFYSASANPVLRPGLILSGSGEKFELAIGDNRILTYNLFVQSNGSATATEVTGITTPVALKPHSQNLSITIPATAQSPAGGAQLTNKFAGGFTFDPANWHTLPGQNVSLSGVEVGVVTYAYGNSQGIAAEAANTLDHLFSYAGSTTPAKFTLGYEASDDAAVTTGPTVIGTIDENGGGLVNGGTFALTKANKLVLDVDYAAPSGKALDRFIVDDANIPYGFMVNTGPDTTCPTVSRGSTPTTLPAGNDCNVRYEFVGDSIGAANTYTVATQNQALRVFKTPAYMISTANGRKRVQPAGEFTFRVKPFADVQTYVNRIGTSNSYEAIFYVNEYAAHNLTGMTNAGIMITPIQNFASDVTVSQPCQINQTIALSPGGMDTATNQPLAGAKFCKIIFTVNPTPAGGGTPNRRVNFRYSSTTDGLYNAVLKNLNVDSTTTVTNP